jgi:hypothetical protein
MLMNSTNSKKYWNCRTSCFLEEKEKNASLQNKENISTKKFPCRFKKESRLNYTHFKKETTLQPQAIQISIYKLT